MDQLDLRHWLVEAVVHPANAHSCAMAILADEAASAQATVTAGDGSQWIRTAMRPWYGRPVPPGRAYWFQRVASSVSPEGSALRGIAGFYSPYPDGKRPAD